MAEENRGLGYRRIQRAVHRRTRTLERAFVRQFARVEVIAGLAEPVLVLNPVPTRPPASINYNTSPYCTFWNS